MATALVLVFLTPRAVVVAAWGTLVLKSPSNVPFGYDKEAPRSILCRVRRARGLVPRGGRSAAVRGGWRYTSSTSSAGNGSLEAAKAGYWAASSLPRS